MLKEFDFSEIPSSIKTCIISHIDKLREHFEEYFVDNFDHLAWKKDTFGKIPSELSFFEKEQLVDLQSESFHKLSFNDLPLSEFWIYIKSEFPNLNEKALSVQIPFATIYLSETGFYALAAIKNKYRGRHDNQTN